MAGKGDIKAGRAFVELTVKNSAFMKGLDAAKKKLESVGASITGMGLKISALGAGMTAPFIYAIQQFESVGSALNDMSARTGVSASTLAELGYAAEQTGAELSDVEMMIKRSQKAGRNFEDVASEIAAIQDPALKAKAALEAFGKSGTKLLPMIQDMAKLRAEARALGIVPSEAAVKLADDLGDAFGKVKKVVGAVFFEIGAALAPVILPMAEAVGRMGKAFIDWVKNNQKTVVFVAMLAAGILGLGMALIGIGGTISMFAALLGGIGTAISVLAPLFAALVSPVGLVTAALALGIAAWMRWTKSGQAATAYIQGAFVRLGEIIGKVWGGVVDALMAGDLELAGKIAIGGLMVAWHEATQDVVKLWADAKWSFMQVWTEATFGLASLFTDAFAGIQSAWVTTVAGMNATWNEFSTSMLNSLNQAQKASGNVLVDLAESTGAVSKEFADAWRDELNGKLDGQIEQRTIDASSKRKQIATDTAGKLTEIEKNRQGAQGNLAADRQAETDANTAAWDKTIADKKKAVEDANRELDNSLAKADEKRKERDAGSGQAEGGPGGTSGVQPTGPLVSAGTFSAAGAVAAFGSPQGGVQKQTLDEIRAMRKLMAEQKKAADREWNQRKADEAKMNIRFSTGTV